jgi:hypothetical protein
LENKRFIHVNQIFPTILNMVLHLAHGNNCKKKNQIKEYMMYFEVYKVAFNLYSLIMNGISLGILDDFFPSNLKTLCRFLTNEFS